MMHKEEGDTDTYKEAAVDASSASPSSLSIKVSNLKRLGRYFCTYKVGKGECMTLRSRVHQQSILWWLGILWW